MLQAGTIFAATFVQVFFIALQTVAIQLKSMAGAAAAATGVAALNILVLGRVLSQSASPIEIIMYVMANALAVPAAMAAGFWFARRSAKKQNISR